MIKISTLYKKNPRNLALVIDEVDPQNQWVFEDAVATVKFDGTACAVINDELYKRYDVKKGKQVPEGAIPCQEADPITGHWPHWVKCDKSKPEDKYFFEGYENSKAVGYIQDEDFTYELCGPKINGNREQLKKHLMLPHGDVKLDIPDLTFEGLKKFFLTEDLEGIVFYHGDGRMCKIRKSDFGIKR